MYTNTISLVAAMQTSIALYQRRHNGKYPAKIFVTDLAFIELVRVNAAVSTNDKASPCRAFGVPISVFRGEGEGAAFYLSDEEA